MKFRVLQKAYSGDSIVEPGAIIESDTDISGDLAPSNPSNPTIPTELAPIYERVPDGDVP